MSGAVSRGIAQSVFGGRECGVGGGRDVEGGGGGRARRVERSR